MYKVHASFEERKAVVYNIRDFIYWQPYSISIMKLIFSWKAVYKRYKYK